MAPPKNGEKKTTETLLLDMYYSIGKIEAQNDHILAEQHRANEALSAILQSQAGLIRRMDNFDGGEAKNYEGGLKADIKDIAALKRQLIVASMAFVALITGAIHVIWYFLTHISEIWPAIKAIVLRVE